MKNNLKEIFKTIEAEAEAEVPQYKIEHSTNKDGYTEFIITPA